MSSLLMFICNLSLINETTVLDNHYPQQDLVSGYYSGVHTARYHLQHKQQVLLRYFHALNFFHRQTNSTVLRTSPRGEVMKCFNGLQKAVQSLFQNIQCATGYSLPLLKLRSFYKGLFFIGAPSSHSQSFHNLRIGKLCKRELSRLVELHGLVQ